MKNKEERFARYGWKVNETNLSTLPSDAPEGAHKLAEWLTLEGRRSSLVEWLGQVKEDGRIHGRTNPMGAWTHRATHSSPNTANIASAFHGEAKSAVDKVKAQYDGNMRACWRVPEGSYMVGTDAEGIQLRVLADWLWRYHGNEDYARAIHEGDKELETDIHNVNKRALGLDHITRDISKTFVYAWILNAGIPKLAQILQTSTKGAKEAKGNFESSIYGLSDFKGKTLTAISKKGWFTGYDGRKVAVPSLHKTLAAILQSGEAVVMKHAMLDWTKRLTQEGVDYKLLTWVHDEWQTEVCGDYATAEYVGKVQRQSIVDAGTRLGLLCPLAGSTDIGVNWNETH